MGPNPNSLLTARALATNPAAVALMSAAARQASETNVKAVTEDRQRKDAKAKVQINLGEGGNATFDAKGISADDFNASVAEAMAGPQRQYLEVLRKMSALADREAIKKELETHEGRLRAAREIGGNWWTSRVDSRRLRTGRNSMETAADQVFMERARKLKAYQDQVGSTFDDTLRAQAGDQTRERAQDTAEKAARKAVYGEIGKADLRALNVESIAATTGIDPGALANDKGVIGAMERRRTALTLDLAKGNAKDRRAAVGKLGKDVVASGQTFEQWKADSEAQVGELAPSEIAQARGKWARFTKSVAKDEETLQRTRRDQTIQERRLQMAEEARDKPPKPRAIDSTEARVATVTELVALQGRPDIEQKSLQSAFRKRHGTVSEKIKETEKALASVRLLITNTEPGSEPDAGYLVSLKDYQNEVAALRADKETLSDAIAGLISQEDYDDLIAAGQTPESIAKSGLKLKKAKK